ncbi:DUF4113 domain-containing protein [Mucilaginibacter sp. CAU 1740]|uniref:DUF4113 domain-containing protein n=1 Tax=Mucilaginibacter sp. CAU 1740 TaxID=3140365 RepID=UPI00325AF92F
MLQLDGQHDQAHQYNMFCNYEHSRKQQLAELMDTLNDRYGRGTVRLGADSFERKWAMKQEFLSKQYTTNWKDIIVVR